MKILLDFVLGVGLFGTVTSSVYTALTLIAVRRFTRQKSTSAVFEPPVSLLKPLHGAEPDLEAHLATFFQQNYPSYEILFCARQPEDEGLIAARKVAARFPGVPVQFLSSGEPTLPNAKILSLEKMAQAAKYDFLIVSDSDVRVDSTYVRDVTAPFADAKVGAVTCLYRGVAVQGGLWSRIEAAAMSVEMSAGVLVADMLEGMKFALGPTMAIRRSCLNEIGGFLPMGDYCADDFLLGNWVAERGHTVVLSHHVIDHVVLHADFWPSMQHQARWMRSTRFSRPKGHFGTALTFSVPFGLLAAAALCGLRPVHWLLWDAAALCWTIGSRMMLAFAISRNVVREKSALPSVVLYPVRDLLGILFWAASYCSRNVLWRNEVYRLETGGRMRRVHR
ncbi:MAG TPA: bacteriohopanetetrol glucosamine biosynthesis glycosyltransferase HpnI [Acidobacteriaceae bacterium]|nr:bacteriohopanetetrol glucosamine biosynthesis glycosyltransferase HpnI [Acidobacteriaceae bacterium]